MAAVLAQHRVVAGHLEELERQPRVTEQILATQLKARQVAVSGIARAYVSQQALRHRWLWPEVLRGWIDGSAVRQELRRRSRRVQYLLVKMRWFGDRDSAVNRVAEELAEAVRSGHRFELELLARHQRDPDSVPLDDAVRRMAQPHWLPTRPHPDLPTGDVATRWLRVPLALRDRVADLFAFGASGL
jgi:hypothetical protein